MTIIVITITIPLGILLPELEGLTACLFVLRNIGVPGTSGRGSSGAEQQAAAALNQMARASGPSLAEVLKPEVIVPLLQVQQVPGMTVVTSLRL